MSSNPSLEFKLVEYSLQSTPEKNVRVPEVGANFANVYIGCILINPYLVSALMAEPEFPFLSNPGIIRSTKNLLSAEPKSYSQKRFYDELYLRICINFNEKMMHGPNREQALDVDKHLIDAVRMLNHWIQNLIFDFL